MLRNFKKYKKFIIICVFITISFLLISIFSCSKQTSSTGIKLEFWTISLRPTYDDYINSLVLEYEKTHPDIKLEWVDMPINIVQQKLLSSIAGGVSPDLINLNTEFAIILAQNQALVDLNTIISKEDKEKYFPRIWEATCLEGASYAVPWYVTTAVIMYNKDIFKKAGLDPNKPPTTWAQVADYARQIKKKTKFYGFMPKINLLADLQTEGVKIVTEDYKKAVFNTKEAASKLQWYVDLYQGDIIPKETINLNQAYQYAVDRYKSGTLGMLITGPQFLLQIQKDSPEVYNNTMVAPLPVGKAKIIPAATMNFVIPRVCKHKKEALELALFLTNAENQLEFCKIVPLLPSVKKAAEDSFFKKGKGSPLEDKAVRISIKQLTYAKDLSLGLPHRSDLSKAITDAVESALNKRKFPQKALNDAAAGWDVILNRP